MSELDIPESWAEVKLNEICKLITDGTHQTPTYANSGIVFLSSRNVTNQQIDWDDVKYIPESLHLELSKRVRPRLNDILLAKNGTTGVAAIVDRDLVFDIYVSLALIRLFDGIDSAFVLRFINSPVAKRQFNARLKGVGVPNLHLKEIREVGACIPPLGEQRRIVTKIESTFKRIEAIEKAVGSAESLLTKYRESLLNKAFRGELVPQDPKDEPALKLLERIRAERAKQHDGKKKKKDELPPITEDEIPFEIPKSWEWVRLGNIVTIQSGNTPKGLPEVSDGQFIDFIKVADMNNSLDDRFIDTVSLSFSEATTVELSLKILPKGSIIFPKRGGAILTNKKRQLVKPAAADTNIMGIIPADLLADYLWEWIQTMNLGSLHTGSTIPQINNGDIEPLLVPIPPLQEQLRIVQKLRTMPTLLAEETVEEIRRCIRQSSQSILSQAFSGRLVPQDPSEGTGHQLLEQILGSKAESATTKTKSKEAAAKMKPRKTKK